jgi:hypothetical protein
MQTGAVNSATELQYVEHAEKWVVIITRACTCMLLL